MPGDSSEISSTTEAAAAQAQSRGEGAIESAPSQAPNPYANLNKTYVFGATVERLAPTAYERKRGDPVFRPLSIFTVDPSTPRLEGADCPGRCAVRAAHARSDRANFSPSRTTMAPIKLHYRRADLGRQGGADHRRLRPSQTDPRFHQQWCMRSCSNVYATFRKALGRHLRGDRASPPRKASYSATRFARSRTPFMTEMLASCSSAITWPTKTPPARLCPADSVFTCLSHDVIAHEVTHALFDGLRSHFSRPSSIGRRRIHEAFADLVALFQRFSYKEVVHNAIRDAHGDITKASI